MGLREEVERAVEAGDVPAAWRILEGERARLGGDPAVATVWMALARIDPRHPGILDDARVVLSAFGRDPAFVIAACAALIAVSELRPPDEPELTAGPAALAAEAARAALAQLPRPQAHDPRVAGYLHIARANALRLSDPRHDDDARAAFAAALALDPDNGGWQLDLARLHLWRGRFADALAAAERAVALMPDAHPARVVLAVAATGAGQGARAAEIWRELGLPAQVTPAGMPLVEGLPPAWIRVPTRGPDGSLGFELAGVQPLSPCHGVVRTPTFREGPCDFGDVVLWDPAPASRREDGAPVFPLLEVLRRGDERRFPFIARQQAAGEVQALARQLPSGAFLFVQHERIDHVCPRCAAGDALVRHEHAPPEEHRVVYGKIVAEPSLELAALRDHLATLTRQTPSVLLAIPALHEALGDTPAAGRAHQAWGGIERTALRPAE